MFLILNLRVVPLYPAPAKFLIPICLSWVNIVRYGWSSLEDFAIVQVLDLKYSIT